jgi:hypothetical protein
MRPEKSTGLRFGVDLREIPQAGWRSSSCRDWRGIPSLRDRTYFDSVERDRIGLAIMGRIVRFIENLASVLRHCLLEEAEALIPIALVLSCLVVGYCLGVFIHDLVLDSNSVEVASRLDALSSNPDKWEFLSQGRTSAPLLRPQWLEGLHLTDDHDDSQLPCPRFLGLSPVCHASADSVA